MPQSDEQQLVVALEARINQFEREMKRANKVAGENFNEIERRGRQAAKNVDQAFSNNRIGEVGKAATLSAQQFSILSAAARDAFASIASGQSAMTVLLQQGSNVQAAIGEDGVMGLLGGIGAKLKGLVSPATVAGAAIAAVGLGAAYAFAKVKEEELAIELALLGIGRNSRASVADVRRVGDEIAATGRISTGAGREIATALASTGKIDRDNLADVAKLAEGFKNLFGSKDYAEAGRELAKVFSDPAKGADTLDERLGVLDDKTRRYIYTLAQSGERQKAIRVLINAMAPELQRAAELTGVWAKAWAAVASAADGAANAVGGALNRAASGPTLQQQLEALKLRRSSSEPDYVEALKRSGLDDKAIRGLVPSYNPDTTAVDAEIKAVEEKIAAVEKLRKAREEEARVASASKMAGEIVASFNAEAEAIDTLTNKMAALKRAIDDPAVAERMDGGPEKARATLKALEERVEALTADYKAGGQAAAQALRAANFASATAGLDSYRRGLAEINRQYDEQIRLARLAGDTAGTAARVSTLEAARGAAVQAYQRENQERAKASVALPPDFVAGVVAAESGGDVNAKNPRSSATGLGQFIDGTWLAMFKKVYSEMAASMSDSAILAMRSNKEYQEKLIIEYAKENGAALQAAGHAVTSANLQLAHFLGAGGAVKILGADRSANAASILPASASANPEVFKRGNATVQDLLDYAERRAARQSSAGRQQTERARSIQAEAEQYNKSATEAEKLRSVEEQLAADRERGGELAKNFSTAQELISASSDRLTPALKAQREEVLALAEARVKAAQTALSSRFEQDMKAAREALGRTSGEQQDWQGVRGYGVDPNSAEGERMRGELSMLRTMNDLKGTASGALSGFASDLMRGTSAAQALQNALGRITDRLISMAADQLIAKAFGSLMGGGGGLFSGLFGGGSSTAGIDWTLPTVPTLGFATGGHVSGPGSSTSDSIPAMLSDGEFVINAAATRRHRGLLEAINAGRVGRFATGGLVGAGAPLPAVGGAPSSTVNAPINITVGQGSMGPEADRKLAGEIGRQVENSIRRVVSAEIQTQMRPGGTLNR